ncbi:ATP-binding protein [Saccharopolyspora griseoalba]|uniref:ATP-binding protein n=1 Tax=Saccharopolyspora griseoalba TaxID=1431848 RepID=A0ABW2LUT8_9PSEU
MALRRIDGHLTRTATEAVAWYRLPEQRWSFRGDADRESLLQAIAAQYAELTGRWLHLRVTSRPYGVADWARAHAEHSQHRLPDVPGSLTWPDYLIGEQQQLLGATLVDKQVYLGVQLRPRSLLERAAERLSRLPGGSDADRRELASLREDAFVLDRTLARSGLRARAATAEEIRWLLHRSNTLGLPAPTHIPSAPADGAWRTEDLAAVSDLAAWTQQPWAPTMQVHGRGMPHAGQTGHVAVLSVGLSQPLDIPETDLPWMAMADQVPVPVEWSARMYVRPGEDVTGELSRQASRVRSQMRHYTDEHGLEAPASLERQAQQVAAIDDDLTTGMTNLATRVKSWWRVAVSGETEDEALARAQQLVDAYQPKITLEHPAGQYGLAREFIPGEALSSTAHTRRSSVVWAASALPQATAQIGDRHGVLIGETVTAGRRPVAWDPWRAQEVRNASGLTAITAGLGGGKSFLGGGIVYKTLRAGAHWTVLDPSGPLAHLASLPEIAPYARVIDLLRAEPGILNPYRVVPTPVDGDYDLPTEADRLREDHVFADATRRRLAREVLTRMLPGKLAREPETAAVILEAVRRVGSRPDAHPGLVIEALKTLNDDGLAEHAHHVWRFLDETRDQMRLLIPEDPQSDPYASSRDDRLTVLGMAGLTLPRDDTPREDWSEHENLGVELLNLAAWLTQRMVYEGPTGRSEQWRHARKGVWIDEAFFLSEVATGRMLMNRFARDSRKWNVRVLLSTQLPADFLRLNNNTSGGGNGSAGIGALLDSAFVGVLDEDNTQSDALELLGVPTNAGYEPSLGALRVEPDEPRQFLFADGDHGVERISVDFSGPHLEHLREALNTTPGQQTPGQQGRNQPADPPPEAASTTITGTLAPQPTDASAAELP